MRHTSSALGKKMEGEAKVLKSLTHPNIIGYRHFKKGPDGAHTLVMEDGQKALYDIMEERNDQELGPFPAEDIEKVVRCIAGALDYIHTEKNLMHGDIKSTNILIVGDFESAKLSDFGVTLPVDSDGKVSDPSADYMGTEAWSAIEVIKEDTITTKADIFSFGLVIYQRMLIWTIATDLFWKYSLPALIRIQFGDLRLKKSSSYSTRSVRIWKMKASLL